MKNLKICFVFSFTIALCSFFISHGQVISFPDNNFKQALLGSNNCPSPIDKNNNGEIEMSEAATVYTLCLSKKNIHDLTGIEFFTSLENLHCQNNLLTKINIQSLSKLNYLVISENLIDTLIIESNSLRNLECSKNKMSYLDIGNCPSLRTLVCSNNNLESLPLNNNFNLYNLYCDSNNLKTLDVSLTSLNDSPAGPSLYCISNTNLKTICINEAQVSAGSSWRKDETSSYSIACATVTSLDENSEINNTRNIAGIYSFTGQLISESMAVNGIYFYRYNDGSSKKILKQ